MKDQMIAEIIMINTKKIKNINISKETVIIIEVLVMINILNLEKNNVI